MDSERLQKRANDIDWSAYRGVEYYRPEAVPVAFRELIDLQETAHPVSYHEGVEHKVISAIGNDHGGSYYPTIIAAGVLLIEISTKGSLCSSRAALRILDTLCASFWAETGNYTSHTPEEVDAIFLAMLMDFVPTLQVMAQSGNQAAADLLPLMAERAGT